MAAWPIEELVLRPLLTVLLAVAVPGLVRRGLLLVMAPRRHEQPFEQAREAAPWLGATAITTLVEVVLFTAIGADALAPPLASGRPVLGPALGALCGWAAYLSGVAASGVDVGRALPSPPAMVTLALRRHFGLLVLTVLTVFCGPPLLEGLGHVGMFATLAVIGVLVQLVGPRLFLALRVFRPGPPRLARIVDRACKTGGAPPAHAALVPSEGAALSRVWVFPFARVVVVTSDLLALDDEALGAVIARGVELARREPALRQVVALVAGVLSYLPIVALLLHVDLAVLPAVMGTAAFFTLVSMADFTRRARAAELTANQPGLARALLHLQQVNLIPLVSRAPGVSLYDQLVAAGHDPGERPALPARGGGAGFVFGAALVFAALGIFVSTRIAPDAIATTDAQSAWWRLRVVPTDGAAMLAVAWNDASRGDRRRAGERIDEAERMGAPAAEVAEARAELLAQEDDCPGAWAAFEEALRVRAEARFAAGELPDVELGGWHMPPSMVEHCAGE